MNNYHTINITEQCGNLVATDDVMYNIVGSSGESLRIDVMNGVSVEIVDFSLNFNVNIHLQKDSTVKIISLKCNNSKSQFHTYIEGEGANFELYGVSIASGDNKVSITSMVHHEKGNSRSYQYVKCVGADSSNTLFEGTVHIVKGAGGSLAYQQNRNLLLSDSAHIESRPWLEIYADDVKCSHGSTTGMINEDEIFYMRQRGISLMSAKKLQMQGFALDIIEHITDQILRNNASNMVINQIESL